MKRRNKIFFITIFLTFTLLIIFSPKGLAEKDESYIDVVIIFKPDFEVNIDDIEIDHYYNNINGISARIPLSMYKMLENSWFVEAIQEDTIVSIMEDTLDWGVDDIDAEEVWGGAENAVDISLGRVTGQGVKVAVLDTGIDYTHPDLAIVYSGGYDYVSDDNDPKDGHGHGTHCAGIIAAADNSYGVIGVAPKTDLYAVRVLNDQGSGSISDIVAGMDWAADNGMDVISMSLGASSGSSSLSAAVDRVYNQGVVIVVASGNDGHEGISYPARYTNAIAVGALDQNRALASFSNYGPEQEMSAPGVDIYSTMPTYQVTLNSQGYSKHFDELSGTSMACPMVAGVCSLILSADPSLSPAEVRNILHNTAIDLGSSGWDKYYGWGEVDARAAVAAVLPTPTITIHTPNNNNHCSQRPLIRVQASGPSINNIWYEVPGYSTKYIQNNVIEYLLYEIWTDLPEGSFQISYKADNFISETTTITHTLVKDTIAPTASLIKPQDHTYWNNAPKIKATSSDLNLNSIWYSVNSNPTKNYIPDNVEVSLDNNVWSNLPQGSFQLKFYADDLAGNINDFGELTLYKDTIIPSITIDTPSTDQFFDNSAPQFALSINEANLENMWYSLNGGSDYTFSSTSGTINQSAWEACGDGPVIIRFSASDTAGNQGFKEITVGKDIKIPIITINTPSNKETFGKGAPEFNLSISEINLDSIWYSLDGGITKIPCGAIGQIDHTIWKELSNGLITIEFYAKDKTGNIGSKEIIVEKYVYTLNDDNGDDSGMILPSMVLISGVIAFPTIIGIVAYKKKKPPRLKRSDYDFDLHDRDRKWESELESELKSEKESDWEWDNYFP